jgi:hypothetical protein
VAVSHGYLEAAKVQLESKIEPLKESQICPLKGTEKERKEWEDIGYNLIGDGKLGLLLLAGGQVGFS